MHEVWNFPYISTHVLKFAPEWQSAGLLGGHAVTAGAFVRSLIHMRCWIG